MHIIIILEKTSSNKSSKIRRYSLILQLDFLSSKALNFTLSFTHTYLVIKNPALNFHAIVRLEKRKIINVWSKLAQKSSTLHVNNVDQQSVI